METPVEPVRSKRRFSLRRRPSQAEKNTLDALSQNLLPPSNSTRSNKEPPSPRNPTESPRTDAPDTGAAGESSARKRRERLPRNSTDPNSANKNRKEKRGSTRSTFHNGGKPKIRSARLKSTTPGSDRQPRKQIHGKKEGKRGARRSKDPASHGGDKGSPKKRRQEPRNVMSRKKSLALDKAQDKMIAKMFKSNGTSGGSGFAGSSTMQMTTGQIALMEKKQKLYKETQPLPLWGIRKVVINPVEKEDLQRFPDNASVSSRYTWYSFIPKNCIEQFHRLPNLWFLFISIIQAATAAATGVGAWATALPLILLLCITGAKDAWEDLRRHRNDTAQGNRLARVVTSTPPHVLIETKWRNIRVGNVLQVVKDEELPADIVLLASSSSEGLAHVDTIDLDGQPDLKPKLAVKETRGEVTVQAVGSVRGRVVCEQPTIVLDTFSGSLKLDAHPRATALDASNFIIKGSKLRNTDFIFGVVVYTGKDTRLNCNTLPPRAKRSAIDFAINQYILAIFFLVFVLVMISILANHSANVQNTFLGILATGGLEFEPLWKVALVFTIVFNNLIPISLMVTIDCVRFLQGLIIENDSHMMIKKGMVTVATAQARSANLNETLGMVDFVFTDKTGTLTQNGMVFRMCAVGGRVYGWERHHRNSHNPFLLNRHRGTAAFQNNNYNQLKPHGGDQETEDESDLVESLKRELYSSFTNTSDENFYLDEDEDNKSDDDDRDHDSQQSSRIQRRIISSREVNSVTQTRQQQDDDERGESRSDGSIESETGSSDGTYTELSERQKEDHIKHRRLSMQKQVTFRERQGQSMNSNNKLLSKKTKTVKGHRHRTKERRPSHTIIQRQLLPSISTTQFRSVPNVHAAFPINTSRHLVSSINVSKQDPVTHSVQTVPVLHQSETLYHSYSSSNTDMYKDLKQSRSRKKLFTLLPIHSRPPVFNHKNPRLSSTLFSPRSAITTTSHIPIPVATWMEESVTSSRWETGRGFSTGVMPETELIEKTIIPPISSRRIPGKPAPAVPAITYKELFPSDSFIEPPFNQINKTTLKPSTVQYDALPDTANEKGRPLIENDSLIDSNYEPDTDSSHTSSLQTDDLENLSDTEDEFVVEDSFQSDADTGPVSQEQYLLPTGFVGSSSRIKSRCSFSDTRIFTDLQAGSWRSRKIDEFLKVMALCNTVVPYIALPSIPGNRKSSIASGVTTPKSPVRSSGGLSGGSVRRFMFRGSTTRKSAKSVSVVNQGIGGQSTTGRHRLRSVDSNQNLPDTVTTASTDKKESSRAGMKNPSDVSHHSLRQGSWSSTGAPKLIAQRRGTVQSASNSPMDVNEMSQGILTDPNLATSLALLRGPPRYTGQQMTLPNDDPTMYENRPLTARNNDMSGRHSTTHVSSGRGDSGRRQVVRGSSKGSNAVKVLPAFTQQRVFNFFRSYPWDGSLRTSILYQTYSPDEECLVSAASHMGYTLVSKTISHVYIEIGESLRRFEFLGVNAWTPSRKRMSVVVKPEGEDYAVLYCKGADETMLDLLDEEPDDIIQLRRHIERFSLRGLRCLVLSCRYLTRREAETFLRLYTDAKTSIYNKDERAEMVAIEFEQNLELLGITGIRDKLQPGVSDVVELINETGARIWMLTGDSPEYSVHVGYSCRILRVNSTIFNADFQIKQDIPIRGSRAKKEGFALFEQFKLLRMSSHHSNQGICLVVTGRSIPIYLSHQELQSLFLLMACSSDTVLCARMTPAQKAQLVHIMKKRLTPSPITLSIGDGASDVSMLQAAHCGVAIQGSEGMEAVAASDFSLPRFWDLRQLLFVHGRLSYLRMSTVILWFFFKSVLLVFPLFLFAFYSLFSGTFLYDSPLYIAYNLFFTSIPIILTGIVEWDIPERVCVSVPIMYTLGRRRLYFNGWIFTFWMIEGTCWSIAIFFLVIGLLGNHSMSPNGQPSDLVTFGFIVYNLVALNANLKLILCSRSFSTLWCTLFVLSVTLQFPFSIIRSYIYIDNSDFMGIPFFVFTSPAFWLATCLSLGISWQIHMIFGIFKKRWFKDISADVSRVTRRLEIQKEAAEKVQLSNWKPSLEVLDTDTADCLRTYYNPFLHPGLVSQLPNARHFQLTDNVLACAPFLSCSPQDIKMNDNKTPEKFRRKDLSVDDLLLLSDVEKEQQSHGLKLGGKIQHFTRRVTQTLGLNKEQPTPVFLPLISRQSFPVIDPWSLGSDPDKTADEEVSLASSSRSDSAGYMELAENHIRRASRRNKNIKVSDLIRRFSLRFKDHQLEAEFQGTRRREYHNYHLWYRIVIISLLIAFIFQFSADIYNFETFSWQKYIASILACLSLFIIVIFTFFTVFYNHLEHIIIILLCILTASHLLSSFDIEVPMGFQCIFGTLSFVILRISFTSAILVNGIFLITFCVSYAVHQASKAFFFLLLPHFLGIQGFTGFAGYRLEYNQRKRFLLNYQVEVSRRKQREILNTMLPFFVVEKMLNATITKDGIPLDLKAEDRGTVTVIFCDVYDFQNIVRTVEPTRLVEVLDSLFLCFDKCAEQFSCTKVETVFETYLSAAGLRPGEEGGSENPKQDAFDALDMALAMLEVASFIKYETDSTSNKIEDDTDYSVPSNYHTKPDLDFTTTLKSLNSIDNNYTNHNGSKVKESSYSNSHHHYSHNIGGDHKMFNGELGGRQIPQHETRRIRVKLGLHSGRVISGVVGAKKPQYALFGDTVNTASRMKLTGQPDMIHISDATYRLIESDATLTWESRALEVKGKGFMTTYLLKKVSQSDYPDFGAVMPTAVAAATALSTIGGSGGTTTGTTSAGQFLWQTNHLNGMENLPLSNQQQTSTKDLLGTQTLSMRQRHHQRQGELNNTISQLNPTLQDEQQQLISTSQQQLFNDLSLHMIPLPDYLLNRSYSDHLPDNEITIDPRMMTLELNAIHGSMYNGHHTTDPIIQHTSNKEHLTGLLPSGASSLQFTSSIPSGEGPALLPDESSFQRQGRIQSAISNVQRSMRRVSVFQPASSDTQSKERRLINSSDVKKNKKDMTTISHILSNEPNQFHNDDTLIKQTRQIPPSSISNNDQVQQGMSSIEPVSLITHETKEFDEPIRHQNIRPIQDKKRSTLKWLSGSGKEATKGIRNVLSRKEKHDRHRYLITNPQLIQDARTSIPIGTTNGTLAGTSTHPPTIPTSPDNDLVIIPDADPRGLAFEARSSQLQLYLFTLSFRDREQEEEYKHFFYNNKSNINTIEQSLIIFLVAFVVYTIMEIIFDQKRDFAKNHQYFQLRDPNQFWAVRAVYTALWFIAWILFHYRARPEIHSIIGVRWMTFVLNATFISAACIFLIQGAWAFDFRNNVLEWLETDTLQLVFFITIMHHNTGLLFQHVILVDSLLFAMVIVFIQIVCAKTPAAISTLFLIFPILFFNALSAHHKENIDRLTWFVSEEMQTTEDRARELLNDMLPRQVLEEFQQDKLKLAYRHDRMTFLFADICGFTVYANSVDATEVVQMLQQLFACFDRDSTRFGLYKLCTIGDAYVAVSEPVTEDNPDWNPVEGAERVLEMANAMIEKIREVRERLNIPGLNMRIGLHYGKCVGGVIGSGRLRYDLWGLDVLTGNLMESNGVPGKINVSEVLKQFLEEQFPDRFRFKFNRAVNVIDQVVNSYLLQDGTEEVGDEEEGDKTQPETRIAAGVRKGKRRFSVLGMRFGGKDDEKKDDQSASGGAGGSGPGGQGAELANSIVAASRDTSGGGVQTRGAVRRGSIARFFGKRDDEGKTFRLPPGLIAETGGGLSDSDRSHQTGQYSGNSVTHSSSHPTTPLTLDKLREMFHNVDLPDHGQDEGQLSNQPPTTDIVDEPRHSTID